MTLSYQRKIFLYERGNYHDFLTDLTNTDWQTLKDNNVDKYAENITERIIALANKHIPNKLIRVRKSDPLWLTTNIKKLLRKKKRLYDKYKKSNNINHFEVKTNSNEEINRKISSFKYWPERLVENSEAFY